MTFPLLHSSSRHEFVGEEKRFTEDDSGYESCKRIVGGKLWAVGATDRVGFRPLAAEWLHFTGLGYARTVAPVRQLAGFNSGRPNCWELIFYNKKFLQNFLLIKPIIQNSIHISLERISTNGVDRNKHKPVWLQKAIIQEQHRAEQCHAYGDLVYLPGSTSLSITLKAQEYEVFTVVPVKRLSTGAAFAPIGLIKMFNSGGAIKDIKYETERRATVDMKVRGCGIFGSYSSIRPKRVTVDTMDVEFGYEEQSRLITFSLEVWKFQRKSCTIGRLSSN
ncbi:hypothetical protein RJ639_024117 [Escallonia herrerae]|uniref:Uncharacterized protein n=1 Tax=Escallonia herrerae TaxID=1293975 RepID=A0AA89ADG8_9ASTE|nr:hypothetical protein RJ639_024117 [Escallonia herrerae]